MEEPYIFPIFMLILNIYLIIILRLKRMAFLKSLKNVESKNVKLYVYYSMDHMKYMFKKNEGSNGRHFKFSVNG